MNANLAIHVFVAGIVSVTATPATAQLNLTCPLDWSALSAIDAPNQDKVIFGLKASEWTKAHLDEMLEKDAECMELSSDSESSKKLYADVLARELYPNGLASIANRDKYAEAQRASAKRGEEQARQADLPPPESTAEPIPRQLQAAAPALSSDETARSATVSSADDATLRNTLLIFAAAAAGIWGWNRFVRNRCPNCRTTSVARVSQTETDRWQGTKQVSERNSRGTNTRHVRTTYVETRFEYECKHCQEKWTKVRKEERGSHSGIGRFLSGY